LKYLNSCILKTSREKNIKIFGMQKCGSGTLSLYCKLFDNLLWAGHGTFLSEDIKNNIQLPGSSWEKNLRQGLSEYVSLRPEDDDLYRSIRKSIIDSYAGKIFDNKFNIQDTCINVAMIRNPYDLLLSFYFHGIWGANNIAKKYESDTSNGPTIDGFSSFILSLGRPENFGFPAFILSCFYPYYSKDGEFIPEFAFKLERLDEIISKRGGWLKSTSRSDIDSLKHRSNKPRLPINQIYSNEMISIMESIFLYELEIFGYKIGYSDDRIIIPKSDIPNLPNPKLDNFFKLLESYRLNKK